MATFLVWKYHPKSEQKGSWISLASAVDLLLLAYFTL